MKRPCRWRARDSNGSNPFRLPSASALHWTGAREVVLQAERVARGGSDEEHVVGMAEAARCLAMLERDLPQADAMLLEAQAIATRKNLSHHAIPAALGMLRFHENKL